MKGISAVIATILMLMITIALAGVAYMYITGIFTQRTGKVVELQSSECVTGTRHILVVRNFGTENIAFSDLTFQIDDAAANCGTGCASGSLDAGKACVIYCTSATTSGVHRIRVIGPANVVSGTSTCA